MGLSDDQRISTQWRKVCAEIKTRVSPAQYRTWLGKLEVCEWSEDRIVLVDHAFRIDWLRRYFFDTIADSVTAACGHRSDVILMSYEHRAPTALQVRAVDGPLTSSQQPRANVGRSANRRVDSTARQSRAAMARESPLNASFHFESLISGPCNSLAISAAHGVATSHEPLHSPLFIYGPVGLGKTHILQATCRLARETRPTAQVLFISCETFTNDFISAIDRRDLDSFRARYRTVDLLLIDDIQCLARKERTQEELFHTFNTLHQLGKQIVLAGDRDPRDIEGLEDRLISRFTSGLVATIGYPDIATRSKIIAAKLSQRDLAVEQPVIDFLADSNLANVRDLEGTINRLTAIASLESRKRIDMAFARALITSGPALSEKVVPQSPPDFEAIVILVCGELGIDRSTLRSASRTRNLTLARQMIARLAERHLGWTTRRIGEALGRDHSSILHARTSFARKLASDPELRRRYERLERIVASRALA
jgi:chromosomal replication initiator protein